MSDDDPVDAHGHGFCPKLVDIALRCRFVVQNMYFDICCIHSDGDIATIAQTVTGQKVHSIDRTSKDTLPLAVCGMRFIRNLVGLVILAEKAEDILDALSSGSRNHFRHFHDPVASQLAEHMIIVLWPQIYPRTIYL